jgi:hypothetical protein
MSFKEKTLWMLLVVNVLMLTASRVTPATLHQSALNYPNLPPSHQYMRRLLDNAFQYANPIHGIIDPASGYPLEGWNQDPENGLFLHSFTQLTAIGAWIELLANIVAGDAKNSLISSESALDGLSLALASLLADQRNPALAAQGLLVNFMGLEGGERKGPLQESIAKQRFIDTFGATEGSAIWSAVVAKGWLQEEDNGRTGRIRRSATYGATHFDGALAPYAEESLKSTLMGLLDQRVITIIFGDNANLTAALARAAGALLRPEIRHDPQIVQLLEQIERFIAGQKEGYAHLFDPVTGTFVFGWDATADRFVGWDDGRGNWVTGQMNYFINEFRGPWTFVVLRYALPSAAIRNAGFKIKPYRHEDGRDSYALAAWDGSAFQLLGLSLFMQESMNPGWKTSLATLVDIELDFSRRKRLPGLLSEAYSGQGSEYTGLIGIPDLAVTDRALITHAPSLYTLGVAYMIAPVQVERFLREQWPMISGLLTDHGPWEGWDTATETVIRYQTTAHTLSLILGGINSAQDNMRRYLDEHRLMGSLAALYAPGDRVNLLAAENEIRAWTSDQSRFEVSRARSACHFASSLGASAGMRFILPEKRAVSLSNGRLSIRLRSTTPVKDVVISFKRAKDDPLQSPTIPVEIFAHLRQTPDNAIDIVLPATPALHGIQEIALTFPPQEQTTPLDISITTFDFIPFDSALAGPK